MIVRTMAIVPIVGLGALSCSRGDAPTPDAPAADLGSAAHGIPSAAVGARIDLATSEDDAEAPAAEPAPLRYGPVPFVGTPKVREGALSLSNTGLPHDVVQGVVRHGFARIRLCYEGGLRGNPTLAGAVRVRFVIQSNGAVGTAADAGSTLSDASVVQCVVRAFEDLAFPIPTTSSLFALSTIYLEPPSP
jgi:hypothetical protein